MEYLMVVMAVGATLLAAISVVTGVTAVADMVLSPASKARSRMRAIGGTLGEAEVLEGGSARLIVSLADLASRGRTKSIAEALVGMTLMFDRTGSQSDTERIAQSGLRGVVSEQDMGRIRALCGLVAMLLLGVVSLPNGAFIALVFGLFGFVLGVRIPSFILGGTASAAVTERINDLPQMIDMIAIGSRAGMGFDAALEAYCKRFDGILSREFGGALESWRVGASTREEALRRLSDQLGVDAVDRFVGAVQQALKLGSPLAPVLSEQAIDARKAKRMAVEEQIAKAPVKILLPMALLILPSMLMLIMGPIVIQLVTGFSGF